MYSGDTMRFIIIFFLSNVCDMIGQFCGISVCHYMHRVTRRLCVTLCQLCQCMSTVSMYVNCQVIQLAEHWAPVADSRALRGDCGRVVHSPTHHTGSRGIVSGPSNHPQHRVGLSQDGVWNPGKFESNHSQRRCVKLCDRILVICCWYLSIH